MTLIGIEVEQELVARAVTQPAGVADVPAWADANHLARVASAGVGERAGRVEGLPC